MINIIFKKFKNLYKKMFNLRGSGRVTVWHSRLILKVLNYSQKECVNQNNYQLQKINFIFFMLFSISIFIFNINFINLNERQKL